MSTSTIILIVVLVVIALIVIGLVAMLRNKNKVANRERAAQLRQQAQSTSSTLPEERARAQEAEAQAERARIEAERAEQRASQAKAAAAHEEARHEDQLRAADRLDPDVDHRADDYSPTTPGSATPAGGHAGAAQGGAYDESGRPLHDPAHAGAAGTPTQATPTQATPTQATPTQATPTATPDGGTHSSGTATHHYDADGRLISDPDYTGPRYDADGRPLDGGPGSVGGTHRA